MTAAAWTIRQPIVGNQQPDQVSTEMKHPLGARMNATSAAGLEWQFIYGRANAILAANAAATMDPATNLITAGAASAIDGTVLMATAVNDYCWLRILNPV